MNPRTILRQAMLLSAIGLLTACPTDSTEPELGQLTMSRTDLLSGGIAAGGSRDWVFNINRPTGFTGPVVVTGIADVAGVSVTPATVSAGSSEAVVTVSVSTSVAPGTYSIQFSATGEGVEAAASQQSLITEERTGTPISIGVPVSVSGTLSNNEQIFRVTVPSGKSQLTVTLSGGSGDVELGVRRGVPPAGFLADCSSMESGNSEICTFDNPAATDWYIQVISYFGTYSGVTLLATVE